MLSLLAPAGRPMLVSHQRLLGLMALPRASVSVNSDIGTERHRTKDQQSAAPRGNTSDAPGVQINKTGRSPSEKEKDFLDCL